MSRTCMFTIPLAALATTAVGQNDLRFSILTESGYHAYVDGSDGTVNVGGYSGRSDWADYGLVINGSTLDVYDAVRLTYRGSVQLPGEIVDAGFHFRSNFNRDPAAGVQLEDGSYHLIDIANVETDAPTIGVIPRLPQGSQVTDFVTREPRFTDENRLYLLDVGNDRMLHYDLDTLEMIGAAPFSVDLGPQAAMEERVRFGKLLISDGSNTGWVYQRGFGAGNTTPIIDISIAGGAVGSFETPSPSTLGPIGLGLLAAARRRR